MYVIHLFKQRIAERVSKNLKEVGWTVAAVWTILYFGLSLCPQITYRASTLVFFQGGLHLEEESAKWYVYIIRNLLREILLKCSSCSITIISSLII